MTETRKLPSRLHHNAYVTGDMEATRRFYEDVIGLPLIATWSESDELFGAVRTYCHCFFGLGDGAKIALMAFGVFFMTCMSTFIMRSSCISLMTRGSLMSFMPCFMRLFFKLSWLMTGLSPSRRRARRSRRRS